MSDLFKSEFHLDEDYLNNLAVSGYYDYFRSGSFLPLFDYISKWMDSISPILSMVELGSGFSPILQSLSNRHSYVGLEFSRECISWCQEQWSFMKNARFIKADLATYFDFSCMLSLAPGGVLYDGNTLWYFNQDKIADYIDKAMQQVEAKFFITMEVQQFFPFPKCSFLKLIQYKNFIVNLFTIPEFKRLRRIEIYERI